MVGCEEMIARQQKVVGKKVGPKFAPPPLAHYVFVRRQKARRLQTVIISPVKGQVSANVKYSSFHTYYPAPLPTMPVSTPSLEPV